jgi:orotidine-5'-phosphate decarboxylase
LSSTERLCVALDFPDRSSARTAARGLEGRAGWFKIGLELFVGEGPDLVADIGRLGKVFLDLKLHDIPNTVEKATAAAYRLGARLCTVHALGGTAVTAAVRGANQAAEGVAAAACMGVLGVTVLTSHAEGELEELIGAPAGSTSQLAIRLGRHAVEAGATGLVCSPHEVDPLRGAVGQDPLLVVPGIRPRDSDTADQRRVATAAQALAAGADFLVVGRPITRAASPHDALCRILDEMEASL